MRNKRKLKKNKLPLKDRLLSFSSTFGSGKLKNPASLLLWFQILSISIVLLSNSEALTTKNILSFIVFVVAVIVVNGLVSKITEGDNYLMLIASMLFSIGIVVIYRINPSEGIKQLTWFLGGSFIFFLCYFILKMFKGWENLTIIYLLGCFIMFGLTLVLGKAKFGAVNWIEIGGFSFQLSEITKILYVFFTASFHENKRFLGNFKYKGILYMFVTYIFIGLFFLQRDLGSAMIFFGIYLITLFVYEYDKKFIIVNLFFAAIGATAGYYLFNHIKVRVSIWLDPWKDPGGNGYQIIQSLFAMAAGGFFGTGLGRGRLELIPVATSDFIFPAIVEEMGVLTGMGIIMLFMILVYRGFKIAIEQDNYFFKTIALGISSLFAVQALVMIGGVLKLIPMTGITIPFVSYGGSSMISSFMSLGILQFCSSDIKGKKVR